MPLVIAVRFHDGRYHGHSDWPPSPARLFQALVAGVGQGEALAEKDQCAFAWLESLEAPVIAVPPMRAGQGFRNYVPNNDRDSVEGREFRNHREYLKALADIRAPKLIRPVLFNAETPLLYVWKFDSESEAVTNAQRTCAIAQHLYQLGRGVDMAWAWGEIVEDREAAERLAAYVGAIYRPGYGVGAVTLDVPFEGSLRSLIKRHASMRARFQTVYEPELRKEEPDRKVTIRQVFVQPPKPRFRQVAYDCPPTGLLFDLIDSRGKLSTWPLHRVVELTTRVRDGAAERLKGALTGQAETVHNVFIGRRDAAETDKSARLCISSLPSIGHRYSDHAVRRILIEIPPNCPLGVDDVEWAFSGLPLVSEHGEILCELTAGADRGMLMNYGVEDAPPAHVWRSITPAALPQQAARRRIEPTPLRQRDEQKGGCERVNEENRAAEAVYHALRHADIRAKVETIRVQREPFDAKGERVEAFAPGTRFPKERLWHVEIAFAERVRGPLVLGDGRYLGLGLMAPVKDDWRDVMVFPLPADARISVDNRPYLLRAVRRALMSLARTPDGAVETLFSGHEPDGAKANSGRHRHVFVAGADINRDGYIDELIVAAPWACDRSARPERREPAKFDRVAALLETVRAGRLGVIRLGPPEPRQPGGALFGPSRVWESETAYCPTRRARRGGMRCNRARRDRRMRAAQPTSPRD
jgi:CRISPR-associated protein Csb2